MLLIKKKKDIKIFTLVAEIERMPNGYREEQKIKSNGERVGDVERVK